MRTIVALCMFSLVSPAAAADKPATRPAAGERKLIEFGWDEPDTAFMRKHAAQMDASPFDGCVFHIVYSGPDGKAGNFTWECWGKRAFSSPELQGALDDLKGTTFKRLRHNFLRFNTTPADVDWFDDFGAILNNARLAARIAREGGAVGLLFDIEQYNAPLFNYRKQRDAAGKSWDQYASQVRRRGRQVMEAFQEGYPGLKVFLTFGYCLPWVQSGKKPERLADCDYGLLAPFVDGLVAAASGGTRLIDGNELAYGYRKASDFADGRRMIRRDLLGMVADPEKYRSLVSVSFGLWMDYDWRNKGWDTQDVGRNPHSPERFGQLVRAALDHADKYVWIYTEKPRWWSAEGGPVELPKSYDAAVRSARGPTGDAEAR